MSNLKLIPWLARGLAVAVGLTLAWSFSLVLRAQDGAPTGLLAQVPADAAGFVHVKAAELWKAECSGMIRDLFAHVGADAVAAIDARYTPALTTLESAVAYTLPVGDEGAGATGLIVSFNTTFDPTRAIKSLIPTGDSIDHFGSKYTVDRKSDLALRVVDGRTLLLSRKSHMQKLLSHEKPSDGPLAAHLATASGKPLFAAMTPASLPTSWRDAIPVAFRTLTDAKTVLVTAEAGKEFSLRFAGQYADATAASAAERGLRDGLRQLRDDVAEASNQAEKRMKEPDGRIGLMDLPDSVQNLISIGASRGLEKFLADPPVKVAGNDLVVELKFDPANPRFASSAAVMVYGVAMPTVQRWQAASGSAVGQQNLKQLAIAMLNFNSTYGVFPVALTSRDQKKALLSWRVAILPFIEQEELYKQFKFDEPWDSDTNKPLIAKMPKVFADLDAPASKEPGMTHYQVFVGGGAGFRADHRGTRVADVQDGMSNTLMIVTATEPTPWTKPGDLPYSSSKPVAKLGFPGKKINVAMFDGSVRQLPEGLALNKLRALISAAGGELISDD